MKLPSFDHVGWICGFPLSFVKTEDFQEIHAMIGSFTHSGYQTWRIQLEINVFLVFRLCIT